MCTGGGKIRSAGIHSSSVVDPCSALGVVYPCIVDGTFLQWLWLVCCIQSQKLEVLQPLSLLELIEFLITLWNPFQTHSFKEYCCYIIHQNIFLLFDHIHKCIKMGVQYNEINNTVTAIIIIFSLSVVCSSCLSIIKGW